MKTKRILALLLAFVLVFSLTAALSACGEDEPVVDEPTADEPTQDDPTTEDPTTEDPTTEEPTTEEPTTEEPTTEEPTTEEPTTEEPTTEEPTTEEPTTEEPTTEEPTTEEPTTEDPTTEEPTPDEPTKDEPANPGEIVLVKGGEAKFKFVVADGYSEALTTAIEALVANLAELEVATEIVADTADTVSACEILIGTVQTRGEQYKLDPYAYGWDGYTIKIIDGKILILGGSEESLVDAIAAFKKDVLGIKKSTKELTDVTMTESQNVEKIQSDYKIESVTVAGNDLKSFVIEAESALEAEYAAAKATQEFLYKKTGMWLSIVEPGTEYTNAFVFRLTDAITCQIKNGFELRVEDGNFVIDCGFANKIEEATLAFVMTEIVNAKTPTPSFNNGFTYNKVDYRNIYYKDFGARGDGYTDDFFALKACHDYANLYGHTVNASSDATYYLGKGSGYESISIQTDTNWKGCQIIFDDHDIKAPEYYPNSNTATGVPGDPEYYTPIFVIDTDGEVNGYSLSNNNLPFTTLKEGYTNIGFAPGYRALIKVYDSNVRHFIRYGANQDNGNSQTEIIMVEADGTIDPMTPVQWDYGTVTDVYVYQMDDAPITISGGEGDVKTHVETIFNGAPSHYTYYYRNIQITRPNVTIKNIKHTITGEAESPTGAPYTGFIQIANTDNVTVAGCEFQCPKGYKTIGSAGTSVGMGTYEINASSANNITWKDCTQSNFFMADGGIKFDGMMGTNYCKNLNFDNVFMCSFDAHKGTYNATVKNSTCEHINFIGEGLIVMENVTIHANASRAGMIFRNDYGATWQGDIKINGLNMKYYDCSFLELGRTDWFNHYFGYQTYLPENIWLENVRTTKISWEMIGDTRIEKEVAVNDMPLHLFKSLEGYGSVNIADPNADMSKNPTDDKIACDCSAGFKDVNEDGLCDKCKLAEEPDYSVNRNPFEPTKNVYIKNCPGLTLIIPNTPQFQDMKLYVEEDGEYKEVNWLETKGTVKIPK